MTDTATIERPTTAVAELAKAAGISLQDIDLEDIALARFTDSRAAVEAATKTLTGVVHDLSTPGKLADAKSLRNRLINIPLAEARKVSKGLKSKLTAVSAAVGAELVALEGGFAAAEMLISPQIEARDAEIAAKKAEEERLAAERKAHFEGEIAKIRDCATRCAGISAERIAKGISLVEAMAFGADWAEFAGAAAAAQAETLVTMRRMHGEAVEAERAAAEAEARRVEQERIAAEQRAEAARLQAERDKFEAERREFERKQAEAHAAEARAAEERDQAAKARMDMERAHAEEVAGWERQHREATEAKAREEVATPTPAPAPTPEVEPLASQGTFSGEGAIYADEPPPAAKVAPQPTIDEVSARNWAMPGAAPVAPDVDRNRVPVIDVVKADPPEVMDPAEAGRGMVGRAAPPG